MKFYSTTIVAGGFEDSAINQSEGTGDTRITFSAKNISVWNALEKTAGMAGLAVSVSDAGYVEIYLKQAE